MADLEGTFIDDSGQTRLEGRLNVPNGISAGFLNGVAVNNGPTVIGEIIASVDGSNLAWGAIISTDTAPPTVFVTVLVFDTTAVTGGLYAWDGTAYEQVGGPI